MPIKVFRCEQQGAPTLSGSVGSLITLLDACLVDGYGQVNVTSITRSGTTATATTAAAHGLATNDWAKIANATQAEYNGEVQVTVTSPTTFTYQVTGSPATPATTGTTITSARAPGGFDKPFLGTNKAVYRAKEGLRHYLRILDDGSTTGGAKEATARGYLTMSDVDNGTEPFPTVAQHTTGVFFYKSNAVNATGRPWILITDGKIFYLQVTDNQSPSPMALINQGFTWMHAFGEFISHKASDAYASMLAGLHATNLQANNTAVCGIGTHPNRGFTPGNTCNYILRAPTGVVGPVNGACQGHGWDQTCLGNLSALPFPHPVDNGYYVLPVRCISSGAWRGMMPGMYESQHGRVLGNGELMDTVVGLEGRKLMQLWLYNVGVGGHCLIDLTGPWS